MIFRFVRRDLENEAVAVAVAFIMSWRAGVDGDEADAALGQLAGFGRELYLSLGMRRDVLLEACDAALCKPGRVLMLAELCLEPECRRGHGAVYDALNCGDVWFARLRGRCPRCRCRPGRTGGSGSPSMSATGCGRTRPRARAGRSATATGGGRTARR